MKFLGFNLSRCGTGDRPVAPAAADAAAANSVEDAGLFQMAFAAANAVPRAGRDPALPDLANGYATPGTLRGQEPVILGGMLDSFRQGYFGSAAAVFDILEEREDAILAVRRKRYSKVRRELSTWSVQHDGTPEGERQATFLTAFYRRLRAENALVPGVTGGISQAATFTLDAIGKKYAFMAKSWSGRGEDLALTLRFVPLWHFTHQYGRFNFCSQTGSSPAPIDLRQWLVASRPDHVMTACSILALFKRLPQQQMVALLEKWGIPNIYGKVNDPKGSKAFTAMAEAVAAFKSGWSSVVSGNGTIEVIDAKPTAANLHLPWITACNQSIAVLWNGGSLGTYAVSGTGTLAGGAQSDDLEDLIADDLVWLSDSWHEGIDRDALYYGLGVTQPQAQFAVGASSRATMADITAGVSLGMRISRNWLHKRMTIPEAEDDEDVLVAPAPALPVAAAAQSIKSTKSIQSIPSAAHSAAAAANAAAGQPETLITPPASWTAPLLAVLDAIAARAADSAVTDAALLEFVAAQAAAVPGLLPLMDHQALAEIFATGMLEGAIAGLAKAAPAGNAEGAISISANPDSFEKLLAKTPVASKLRTAEWERVPLALRERAQFSAGVESVRFLGEVQRSMQQVVGLQKEQLANGKQAFVDRSVFISKLREVAQQEGLGDGTGGLTDVQSSRRLGLIYDQQRNQALGFARWKGDQQDGALDAFPAQELIREEARMVPRDWKQRWAAAGGSFFGGRMIALKTDPIWSAISRFGTPWPPFDFGSGMGVEDVDREEAERLGLLQPDEVVEPSTEEFNDRLEASASNWRPDQVSTLKLAFGDQVAVAGGRVQWQGNLIGDLAREIQSGGLDQFDASAYKGRAINFGQATAPAVTSAAKVAKSDGTPFDLAGANMTLDATHIKHILEQHVAGAEKRADQAGMDIIDLEMIPHVWRAPDSMQRGGTDRTLIMKKTINGKSVVVGFELNPKQKDWQASTSRIENE